MNIPHQSSQLPPRHLCKFCAALGTVLALKGIKGAVSVVQGSQACADFLSGQLLSHFQEPVELFSFGLLDDENQLAQALDALRRQCKPELIGIVTPCSSPSEPEKLTELLSAYQNRHPKKRQPAIVQIPFSGLSADYVDGFQAAIVAVTEAFAARGRRPAPHLNLFPGIVSPADLRYIQEILTDFRVRFVLLPDYSRTLDGPLWESYAQSPKVYNYTDL